MKHVTLAIKRINERKLKAEAVRRGLTLSQALEEVTVALKGLSEKPRHAIVTKVGEDAPRALELWGSPMSR